MRTLITWLHLLGMTFWTGGIFIYILVLTPSLKVLGPADRGKLVQAFIKRFAPLNWVAIILVLATGIIAMIRYGISLSGTMLVKHILVALLVVNGVYLSLVLGRKLASLAPPPGPPKPSAAGEAGPPPVPSREFLAVQRRMTLCGYLQVALAAGVLFVMAL